MERILILGASGLSGNALSSELSKNSEYEVYGTYRNNKIKCQDVRTVKFAVDEIDKIGDIIKKINPSRIIYCLNGPFDKQFELLYEIVRCLRKSSVRLYFCSTGNVFDGDPSKPHYKNEVPVAESDYGKFKIKCENILKENLKDRAIILRLSAIWGRNSKRMQILKSKAESGEKIDVYLDSFINVDTDVMLAKQIRYIIENDLKGIFHMGSSNVIGYGEMIEKVAEGLGLKNLNYNRIKVSDKKYYLAVMPDDEFPEKLKFTSKEVIDYLIH